MDAREILAANLTTLHNHYKLSDARVAEKYGIAKGTWWRARRAKKAVDLTTIQQIADAFGLTAWQLLVPNLDPTAAPTITHLSAVEKALYAKLTAGNT